MAYVVNGLAVGMGIVGIISFVLLAALALFFGRLVKHQMKIWLLAKRGYTQIRHIKEDMTEKYFFLRIKGDHFDFDKGIYMEQKDVRTKTKAILAPLDYDLLDKKEESSLTAEEKQIKGFLNSIKNSQVMDISTLSWGIPTITYYGNNPNPVNVKDIKKVYDAKNIAAMIKRILMTKEWKFVRMVLLLTLAGFALSIIIGFFNVAVANSNANNLASCLAQLNVTTIKYSELLNSSRVFEVVQNSTVII